MKLVNERMLVQDDMVVFLFSTVDGQNDRWGGAAERVLGMTLWSQVRVRSRWKKSWRWWGSLWDKEGIHTHGCVCVCVNESERSANRKLWWVAGCKDGGFQVLWINPQSNLWCSKEMEKRMEGRWNGWRETSVRVICDGRIAVVSWNRRFVRR